MSFGRGAGGGERGPADGGLDARQRGGGGAGEAGTAALAERRALIDFEGTCDELSGGGRRDLDAGGETGVRESHDEFVDGGRRAVPGTRRRPPRPRRVFREAKTPEVPRLETLGGLRAFASGADPAWTA